MKGERRGQPAEGLTQADGQGGWGTEAARGRWGAGGQVTQGLPRSLWLRLCPQSSGKPLNGLNNPLPSSAFPSAGDREAGRSVHLSSACSALLSSFPPRDSALEGPWQSPQPPSVRRPSGPVPTQLQRDPVLHCREPAKREPPADRRNWLDGGHKTQSAPRRREETLALGLWDVRLSSTGTTRSVSPLSTGWGSMNPLLHQEG